jgi:sugar phosphate isomerase/epimerase
MMKLSVITDEISQDLERAVKVMLEYGVAGAELRGVWNTNIADIDDATARRVKKLLDANGIKVSSIASPFYKCDLFEQSEEAKGPLHLATPRDLSQQMDVLHRCIDLAHFFETPIIRVFSFWRRGELTPEVEKRIVDSFAEPLKLAEQEDVILALENEHSCYLGTGAEVARVVRTIDSPHLRICWDPGNAMCAGEQPYPDGYGAVRDSVVHVHVKDGIPEDGDIRWVVVGEGVINYKGQFDALRRDGYTGWVSLETHARIDGDAEWASRLSLQALRQWIEG